jgi:hypothetical protein
MANIVNNIDRGLFHHPYPSKTRVRPVFMEPIPLGGGILPIDGGYYRRGIIVSNNDNRAVRMRKLSSSSSSSFPIKDDAGYIGYLSDDESGSESGGDASDVMMKVLNRRRRQLMGSDMSFSGCLFLVIMVALLMAVVVAMIMFVK